MIIFVVCTALMWDWWTQTGRTSVQWRKQNDLRQECISYPQLSPYPHCQPCQDVAVGALPPMAPIDHFKAKKKPCFRNSIVLKGCEGPLKRHHLPYQVICTWAGDARRKRNLTKAGDRKLIYTISTTKLKTNIDWFSQIRINISSHPPDISFSSQASSDQSVRNSWWRRNDK